MIAPSEAPTPNELDCMPEPTAGGVYNQIPSGLEMYISNPSPHETTSTIRI